MTLLTNLPVASDKRVAVHITNDALRHVRGGHPWIWDGSIVRTSHDGRPGDLAVVFDDKRNFAAIGLWDPTAPIAVRILHHGSPENIGADFFANQILNSYARRQVLHDDPRTTGYRLIHGENDALPGLVVDRYADTLVVKLDSPVWVPHLRTILEPIADLADAERVVLRASRRISQQLPQQLLGSPTILGTKPDGLIRFLENELAFDADVEQGQKTGHFLDQRDNRRLLGDRCHDATVLDVFCNTGGFSVYAAAGGARSVHSVDVSKHAIAAASHHVELNREARGFKAEHTTQVADAFDAMDDLIDRGRRFDIVIVDPPTFAPNTAAVPAALHAYRRLTAAAVDLLAPGGTLLQASCSSRIEASEFHDLINDEVASSGRRIINPIRTQHALDHPISFDQGAYLKALLAEVIPAD